MRGGEGGRLHEGGGSRLQVREGGAGCMRGRGEQAA